jgi:antitoxin component YwqK of YwqJK toxin-antitoxin module
LEFDCGLGALKYEGGWKNNKYEGSGKYFRDDGSLNYEGEWSNNMKNGKGKYYYADGKMAYEGYFKDDEIDKSVQMIK